jgi:hypothetical protein
MMRTEHDCRLRTTDAMFRTRCNCGWQSDLYPDSSTAWSAAQEHVVMGMETNQSIAAAHRELVRERDAWDEWQVDPDLLAAQERVRAAEERSAQRGDGAS